MIYFIGYDVAGDYFDFCHNLSLYSQLLLVVQNGLTVVYFVQGNAKGDYCEYDTNYTVDHCRLQVNSQWSTARRRVMLGATVMPITVYSRLPVVQYGCRVVYFGEWDANGDYIDMYCNDSQRQGGLTGW